MIPTFYSIEEVNFNPVSIAIGNFDGVHRGHQALLKKATSLGPSLAITFEPHPFQFFGRDIQRLTTPETKIKLIQQTGVNGILVMKFNQNLAQMAPEDFANLLFERLHPQHIWVGMGFKFGKQRLGTPKLLKELLKPKGIKVHILKSVTRNETPISSTRIRNLLKKGEIEEAALLLGRVYEIEGKVVTGLGYGKKLGFPTINLETSNLIPREGVYAGYVKLLEGCWPAAISIGRRISLLENGQPVVEAHLLDFKGDLYGQYLSISFLYKIRNQQKFANEVELIEKIQDDIRRVKALLLEEELHEETYH